MKKGELRMRLSGIKTFGGQITTTSLAKERPGLTRGIKILITVCFGCEEDVSLEPRGGLLRFDGLARLDREHFPFFLMS